MEVFLTFLAYNAASLIAIACLDCLIRTCNTQGRWFQLHATANAVVTAFTLGDVIDCLMDHSTSNHPLTHNAAGAMALSIHIYHILAFPLRKADWIHHCFSVFLCTPLCYINTHKSVSVFYFFCTGLPGMIDYSVLALVKNGLVKRLTQKKIYSYINPYVRMPGGTLAASLILQDAIQAGGDVEQYTGLALATIVFVNSAYYGKQAIENHVETASGLRAADLKRVYIE